MIDRLALKLCGSATNDINGVRKPKPLYRNI